MVLTRMTQKCETAFAPLASAGVWRSSCFPAVFPLRRPDTIVDETSMKWETSWDGEWRT